MYVYLKFQKPLVNLNINPEKSLLIQSATTSTSVLVHKTSKIQINEGNEMEEMVGKQKTISDSTSESEERRKKLEILEGAWNELQNANPYKKLSDHEICEEQSIKLERKTNQVIQMKSSIPSVPKTCSQFELHWRTLKTDKENLYSYLKVCFILLIILILIQ